MLLLPKAVPDAEARDLMSNYVAMTKSGQVAMLDEMVLFSGKQLPPRSFNYHFKIEEVRGSAISLLPYSSP